MADAYTAYASARNLSAAAKDDLYQIVLPRSGAPDSEVLAHVKLKVLSVNDAKEVLKSYKMPPVPPCCDPYVPISAHDRGRSRGLGHH
jgi:hypothetical protein